MLMEPAILALIKPVVWATDPCRKRLQSAVNPTISHELLSGYSTVNWNVITDDPQYAIICICIFIYIYRYIYL